MNWKTLALCSAMAAVAFAGCGNTVTPPTDGSVAVDMGTMAPETHTYVIGLIQTATADTTQAYGFDLDMMHNGMMGTCTDAIDFVDPYHVPPMAAQTACTAHMAMMGACTMDTAHNCDFGANSACYADGTGVDNQLSMALPVLGGMLGADGADGAIRDQIESGKILLMLQVSNITSYTEDPMVGVHAILGVMHTAACTAHADMASCAGDTASHCAWAANTTGGGTCNGAPAPSTACMGHSDMASCSADVMNACNWSMANMNCTGIAAGQTFTQLMDLGMVNGSIHAGRLNAVTQMLPLHFVAMGRDINLVLRTVHFGGRITATNITQGEFGAQVNVADIVMLAQMLGLMIDLTTIESFVSPDIMPSADTNATCGAHTDMASCAADHANYCTFTGGACHGAMAGAHCAAISAGMGYAAIAATLGM